MTTTTVPSEPLPQPQASLQDDTLMLVDEQAGIAVLAGWPMWHTHGGGGDVPDKEIHDFEWRKLVCGARIDNSRGVASDDHPGIRSTSVCVATKVICARTVRRL